MKLESHLGDVKKSCCVRSIRGFSKFSRDPYYEPTIVVHDVVHDDGVKRWPSDKANHSCENML